MKENEKVVIVGAGMAGLTAAAYLTKQNYDVLLIDKSDKIGGLVSTFNRDGFSFDTGPRAFVNSGMVKPILKDLGIEFDVVKNEISIAIEDQLIQIDTMNDIHKYKRMLLNLYPESAKDIEKIVKVIYKLSKDTAVLYEFDNPSFVDYTKDKKVLFTKLIPWSFKFLYTLMRFKKYSMPMEEFFEKKTDNQSLIDIISQHFFTKTPAYFTLGYFHVYLDYFYPLGGTGSLAKIIYENVLENGATFKLNTQIEEVKANDKKVIDTESNEYSYDHLIWAADLKTFYRQINPVGLDKNIVEKLNNQSEKVLNAKTAESVFIMFAAVDRPASYFNERGGKHMFFTPSKEGLGEVNRSKKRELIDNFEKKSKKEVLEWVESFCDFNTYEVSVPVLRDATLAPVGKTGLMISCLFDYELASKIDKAGWIEEFKTKMEERIIKIFSNSIYPELEKDVLFKLSTTPLTINKVTGNSNGAIVGWSFESKAPVFSRLRDIPKSALTPIPGIYKASQWAYAPAGVPIAMLTGWYATQKIINNK